MKKIYKGLILSTVLLGASIPITQSGIMVEQKNDFLEKDLRELGIDGKISFSEITDTTVKVTWAISGTYDLHEFTNFVLKTDQGIYREEFTYMEYNGSIVFTGLKPGTTYTGVQFGLEIWPGETFSWFADDSNPVTFTTLPGVPLAYAFNAEVIDAIDKIQFSYGIQSNGTPITSAKIIMQNDDASIINEVDVPSEDGFHNKRIDSEIYDQNVNSKLVYTYVDLESGETVSVEHEFNDVTTNGITFLDLGTEIVTINQNDLTLNWNFVVNKEIEITGVQVSYKETEAGEDKVIDTLSKELSGSYTISELKANTKYYDLKIIINYGSTGVYEFSFGDFTTKSIAPVLVAGTITSKGDNAADIDWEITLNGNEITGINISADSTNGSVSTDVTLGETPEKGKLSLTDLPNGETYNNIKINVTYKGLDGIETIVSFDLTPNTFSTASKDAEITFFNIDNIQQNSVRVNWVINNNENTINSITLSATQAGVETPVTASLGKELYGQTTIENLEMNTVYSNVTLTVEFINSNGTTKKVEAVLEDSVTTSDFGPIVNNLSISVGVTKAEVIYDISDTVNETKHTVTDVSIIGKENSSDGTSKDVAYSLGAGLTTATPIEIWGLQQDAVYTDVQLKITYDDDKISYSNLDDFTSTYFTDNYIDSYIVAGSSAPYNLSIKFNAGLDEISNIELINNDSGLTIYNEPSTDPINMTVVTNNIKVNITLTDPTSTVISVIL